MKLRARSWVVKSLFIVICVVFMNVVSISALAAPWLVTEPVLVDPGAPTAGQMQEMQQTSPCIWSALGAPQPMAAVKGDWDGTTWTANPAGTHVRLEFDLATWSWCTDCGVKVQASNSAGPSAWTSTHQMNVPALTIIPFVCVTIPLTPTGLSIVP